MADGVLDGFAHKSLAWMNLNMQTSNVNPDHSNSPDVALLFLRIPREFVFVDKSNVVGRMSLLGPETVLLCVVR